MDGWEWTRISVAVTVAVGAVFTCAWLGDLLLEETDSGVAAYEVEGVPAVNLNELQREWPGGLDDDEEIRLATFMRRIDKAPAVAGAAAGGGPAALPPDLGTLLASADVASGERAAQACKSCHTFERGGADRIGPNLFNVVGRRLGAQQGFAYSGPFLEYGGSWTYEELDHYLNNPARAIPGNRMGFAGIRNPRARANLLAYLASLSSNPLPFPQPAPAVEESVEGSNAVEKAADPTASEEG